MSQRTDSPSPVPRVEASIHDRAQGTPRVEAVGAVSVVAVAIEGAVEVGVIAIVAAGGKCVDFEEEEESQSWRDPCSPDSDCEKDHSEHCRSGSFHLR